MSNSPPSQKGPFPHTQNAEGLASSDLSFGDPAPIVLHLEEQASRFLLQAYKNPGCIGMSGDIGQDLLEDSENAGRPLPIHLQAFGKGQEFTRNPHPVLEVHGLPLDGRQKPQVVQDSRAQLRGDFADTLDGGGNDLFDRLDLIQQQRRGSGIPRCGESFLNPGHVHLESRERLPQLIMDLPGNSSSLIFPGRLDVRSKVPQPLMGASQLFLAGFSLRDIQQDPLEKLWLPIFVLNHHGLVPDPQQALLLRVDPIFQAEPSPPVVHGAVGHVPEHPFPVFRVKLFEPQEGIGKPFFPGKPENRLDLRADVEGIAHPSQGGNIGNHRDLLDQGPIPDFRLVELGSPLLQGFRHFIKGTPKDAEFVPLFVRRTDSNAQVPGSQLLGGIHQAGNPPENEGVSTQPGGDKSQDAHQPHADHVSDKHAVDRAESRLFGDADAHIDIRIRGPSNTENP